LELTPAGAEAALHVIRAHRLWERYLAEETGYQEAEWHDRAEQEEHDLTPEEADKLSFRLGHPTHDPHGDPIPTANGQLQSHGGQPLTTMQPNDCLRIVHIEDEPETVYAQLVAEGIYPGMQVRVIEVSPHRIRFLAGGEEHVLAPIFAANLSVTPVSNGNIEAEPAETLLSLNQGEMGEVLEISRRVRGPERRRLMDMGILPGTKVGVELNGPNGDPRAYRIRGALLALRSEQAQQITIRRLET
jgi:DtxR family Mn-dependent transcriptional regulator